jgi:hypothetical protein
MRVVPFVVSFFPLLGLWFVGCGDECSRVGDCNVGEVCLQGTCVRSESNYLPCTSNADCSDSGALVCRGGRCTFPASGGFPEVGPRSDGGDVGAGDGGAGDADTGAGDGGAGDADTGAGDGGAGDADTGAGDGGAEDTGSADGGEADAADPEAGVGDTGAADGGPGADGGS